MKKLPLFLCVAAAMGFSPSAARSQAVTLGPVNVAGVSVEGMLPQEARDHLKEALRPRLKQAIVLTDGVEKLTRSREALGIALDTERMVGQAKQGPPYVPLYLKADRTALADALKRIATHFEYKGRSARVIEHQGRMQIVSGEMSRKVDIEAAVKQAAEKVAEDASALTFPLKLSKTPPKVSADDLKGIDGQISQFITRFSPRKRKRTENIRLAVAAIDGTVVPPGQVFSLNDTVGERTRERGFQPAKVFKDGEIVEDLGGGVSQVTGTLFNAALMAGLPIVHYRTHQRPVDYLPIGRDATVWWGSFDMKFKNDTPAPIYVAYSAQGNRAVATLYGKKGTPKRIRLRVTSQKLGPRHITARLYRSIREEGKPVKKEFLGTSVYKWKPDKKP
ncbi:MAG: VanW family protein [Armatimonadetes bacterium]|nr:VanW family protein [Armatimonadota bacterium]